MGGKRATGRNTIRAVFSHFSQAYDLESLVMYIVFLMNYLCGCRVTEITSLVPSQVDFYLNLIKFRTKDAGSRKNTTKVIPLPPFLRSQLFLYTKLLEDCGHNYRCSSLLFRMCDGNPIPITTSFVNDYYHKICIANGIEHFTSHCVRYQTQTDFTKEGLSFEFTNCVLSHYSYRDEIFNPYADISFVEFEKEYYRIANILLQEYLA